MGNANCYLSHLQRRILSANAGRGLATRTGGSGTAPGISTGCGSQRIILICNARHARSDPQAPGQNASPRSMLGGLAQYIICRHQLKPLELTTPANHHVKRSRQRRGDKFHNLIRCRQAVRHGLSATRRRHIGGCKDWHCQQGLTNDYCRRKRRRLEYTVYQACFSRIHYGVRGRIYEIPCVAPSLLPSSSATAMRLFHTSHLHASILVLPSSSSNLTALLLSNLHRYI